MTYRLGKPINRADLEDDLVLNSREGICSPTLCQDGPHFQPVKDHQMSRFPVNPESSNELLTISKSKYMNADSNPATRITKDDALTISTNVETTVNRFQQPETSNDLAEPGPVSEPRTTRTSIWRHRCQTVQVACRKTRKRVLNAFQENGWPTQISDPLEIHEKICPKRRLHDTLKCLNRKQLNKLIKFRGDGTGRGVLLEINVEEDGK